MSTFHAPTSDPPDRTAESGQALSEYALIIALVSVAAIVLLQVLGAGVTSTLQSIIDTI